MTTIPKKVRRGDDFDYPSDFFNLQIDIAQAFVAGQLGASKDGKRFRRDHDIAWIKNDSGSDVDRFQVLGIDGVVFPPADNETEFKTNYALKGIEPTTDDHAHNFVITTEPIKDGKLGRGVLDSITPVKIDVKHVSDVYAGVKNNSTTELQSGNIGSQILYKESGTGVKWGLVRLGDSVHVRLGKTAGEITAGSSGNVTIYADPNTSAAYTVNAKLDWMHGGEKISAEKEVCLMFFPGENVWRILWAECETN